MSWISLGSIPLFNEQWSLTPPTTARLFRLDYKPKIGFDAAGRLLLAQYTATGSEPYLYDFQRIYCKPEYDLIELIPAYPFPERQIAIRRTPTDYLNGLQEIEISYWDEEPPTSEGTTNNTFNVSVEALPEGDRPSAQLVSNTNETVQPNTNTVLAATNGVQGYGGITGDAQNPSRIVLGASGLYLVGLQINYVANTVGNRAGWIRRNGSIINPNIEIAASASRYLYAQTSLVCNAGDYLELLTFQSASVALSCTWRMYTFKVS
ncbi:hypothetical protein ACQ4M4_18090 [Leptolyngbya sp. AN02str]|uniref:hypothetical protein n=1 Tax=Leptolyngbya sp. AN02str TaxID=3423363 RepID=UPI003D31AEE7